MKKHIQSLVIIIVITMLQFVVCSNSTAAIKGSSILTDMPGMNYGLLNSSQQANYDIIAANPYVTDIMFVQLNELSVVQDSGKVLLSLPFLPCDSLYFHVSYAEYNNDSAYGWQGEIVRVDSIDSVCSDGFLTVVNYFGKGGLMGRLSLNGFVAELQDLGDGVQVVAIMNSEALDDLVCGYEVPENIEGERPTGPDEDDDCLIHDVKVLVVYTTNAKNFITTATGTPNLWLHAYVSLFITNGALSASLIPKTLVLAGVEELSYTGSTNSKTDVIAFSGVSVVQAWRNTYHADIAMLMVEPQKYGNSQYGNSLEIGSYNVNTNLPDKDYAYCVADLAAAFSKLTAAHELGHLLAGRHGVNDDNVNSLPFLDPNAHAHRFTKWFGPWIVGRYRTTITDGTAGDRRLLIPLYSNPSRNYEGLPSGTSVANNAFRINTHIPIVGSFYTEVNPFSNNIIASNIFYPPAPEGMYNICEYYLKLDAATNSCGQGPFVHTWYMSSDGINYYSFGTGATNYFYPYGTGTVFIKLRTISLFSGTVYTTRVFNYNCNQSNQIDPWSFEKRTPITEATLYPNPSEGDFVIHFKSKGKERLQVLLVDVVGRTVDFLYTGTCSTGENKLNLSRNSNIAAGVYFVKLMGESVNQTYKIVFK